jgi:hypothetical protein
MAGSGGSLDAGRSAGGDASSGSAGSGASGGGAAGSGATGGSGGDATSWIRQFGTDASDESRGVGVDAQGNIILLHHEGNVVDMRISKFDASGNPLWSIETEERLVALAVEPSGNLFAVGSVDVDEAGQRSSQALLVSYDTLGNQRFRTTFGSMGRDVAQHLNVSDAGHSFVVWSRAEEIDGGHRATSEFDAAGTELTTAGIGGKDGYLLFTLDRHGNVYGAGFDTEYFVRKFNPQGGEVWTTHVPGIPAALFADEDENLFLTASLDTPTSFRKLDRDGELVLSVEFAGTDSFAGLIATDPEGNVFVSGSIMPDALEHNDTFVYRFDPEGNELGHWPIASDDYDVILALAADPHGAVVVAGNTDGTLAGQMSFGDGDAFVARMKP